MLKILISLILFINLYGEKRIKICDDIGEWAPYNYFQRINGKIVNKHKLEGIMPDLLNKMFTKIDIKYSIDMIPWTRCLNMVEHYDKNHKYGMFIDGAYTKKRAKLFLISNPVYYTHQTIFYSDKKFPKGIVKNGKVDINKYKICDVHGYAIAYYYTQMGLNKTTKIDRGAKNYTALFKKISSGRCDIVVTSGEPVYGGILIGKIKMPKDIKSQIFPNLKPISFHIFISKQLPQGEKLLKQINGLLKQFQENGTLKQIEHKYLRSN